MATIETKSQHKYSGEGAETFRLATVPVAEVLANIPGFQRDRMTLHHEKIAREFDRSAYALPIVASFRGHLVVIDGQQRFVALESLGHETTTVLLLEGVPDARRLAELYLLYNRDRKNLTAFAKYVGALEAEDRGTLEIAKILDGFGLEMAVRATMTHVPAGAVTFIYGKGGRELLTRVLQAVGVGWEQVGREKHERMNLLGVMTFVRLSPENLDEARLARIMKKLDPALIVSEVEARAGVRNKLGSYADRLGLRYNKGLRGKARIV